MQLTSVQTGKLRFNSSPKEHADLKKWVLVYFLLLILEGALRKWILPFLSTPLLIVRDPVAIYILYKASKEGIMPKNAYVTAMVAVGIIASIAAMTFGHRNIFVTIYGARTLLLHFPLIFVIGRVLSQADVIRIGKLVLYMTTPMAFLIAAQFYSPQSAYVNRGVGGDIEGAGFSGALGFMRPPGTFSFTNGTTLFFSLAAVFIFYFWLYPHLVKKYVLIAATVGLAAAIPLSISRALFFQVLVTGFFVVMAMTKKPKYLGKVLMAVIGIFVVFIILSNYSFFNTATEAFTNRFEGANETEGGMKGVVGERYFGGMLRGIITAVDIPFFGYGLGIGTSAGAMMMTGQIALQMGEDEWGRITGEMGLLLGLILILIRLSFSFKLFRESYKKLEAGDLLAWILVSFTLTSLPQGQWAQPTALGFCVIICGLNIAALKRPVKSFRSS